MITRGLATLEWTALEERVVQTRYPYLNLKGVEALLGSRKLRERVRAGSGRWLVGSEGDRTSTKDPSDPAGEFGAAGWPLGTPKDQRY